jgi:Zn-dependent protease/CBS domain-containing protein
MSAAKPVAMTSKTTSPQRKSNATGPALKWNIKLGRIFGIDVYLHFTFLIILAFLAVAHWLPSRSLDAALSGVLFFMAIFACVLLHEFGHALAARRFGVGTRDITLLPIGGIARLERVPDKPKQEFWIAIAGPAVNVGIGVFLTAWLAISGSLTPLSSLSSTSGGFVERLLAVNIFLVLFNLLPAFPMDGGRILRSLLALKMEYVRATNIAARLGQGMAFLFAFAGLFGNPMLLFIALFVWMGASSEMGAAQARSVLAGMPVSQAMVTEFVPLRQTDTLGHAARAVLAGSQQDFPVLDDGRVIGLLERRQLLDGLTRLGPEAFVDEVMVREFPVLAPDEMIEPALARQHLIEFPMLPVIEQGRLVGLLTGDNLMEMLLIKSALGKAPNGNGSNHVRSFSGVVPPLIPRRTFR